MKLLTRHNMMVMVMAIMVVVEMGLWMGMLASAKADNFVSSLSNNQDKSNIVFEILFKKFIMTKFIMANGIACQRHVYQLNKACSPLFQVCLVNTKNNTSFSCATFGPYLKTANITFESKFERYIIQHSNPIQFNVTALNADATVLRVAVFNFLLDDSVLIDNVLYSLDSLIEEIDSNSDASKFRWLTQSNLDMASFGLFLQARAYCANGFYGTNCNVECKAKNSTQEGHYTCSTNGTKICNPGWIDPINNCREAVIDPKKTTPAPNDNGIRTLMEITFVNYTYHKTIYETLAGLKCNKENKPCSPLFHLFVVPKNKISKDILIGPFNETNNIQFKKYLPTSKGTISNPFYLELPKYDEVAVLILSIFNNKQLANQTMTVASVETENLPASLFRSNTKSQMITFSNGLGIAE